MIIFNYPNIVCGGIHTLLLRLCSELKNRGIQTEILYRNIFEQGKTDYLNSNIDIYQYSKELPSHYFKNQIHSIITFEFGTYVETVAFIKKIKSRSKVFLYSVHPYTFDYYFKDPGLKIGLIKSFFSPSFCRCIAKGIVNGYMFFMDEENLEHSIVENNVLLDENEYDSKIVRLIFPCTNKEGKENKTIQLLSVSRADFPFKGYLKGLIEIFSKLKERYNNLSLTIISSGNDLDKLEEWIKESNSKISLVKNVSYSDLFEFYKKSNIYIGMGTTVLEAASESNIVIPVSPYTYECKSDGLFSDNPKWLLTEIDSGNSIENMLKNLIEMPSTRFKDLSNDSLNKLQELYSSEVVINSLINILDKADTVKQYKELPLVYLLMKRISKLLRLKFKD